MNTASLIISIVSLAMAVAVAGFGVVLQFIVFKSTSEQTGRVSDSLASFQQQLAVTLARLEGRTDVMSNMQNQQFNTMLDAFVRSPHATARAAEEAQQSAASSQDALEEISSLERRVDASPELAVIKPEVEKVKRAIESANENATNTARLAQEIHVGRAMFQYFVSGAFGAEPGGYKSFSADVLDLLNEVKRNTDRGERADPERIAEWHQRGVYADPQAPLTSALNSGFVVVQTNAHTGEKSLAVTEAGEALRRLIERYDEDGGGGGGRTYQDL